MTQQTINVGTVANDGTGDPLRTAGQKINDNFTELYGASGSGNRVVTLLVTDPNGDAITTGDGKAYFRVPSTLDGMDLLAVAASLSTVSSSGAVTVQIRNATQAMDMLSTPITIDQSETDTLTAATPAVIDMYAIVSTGDQLYIDCDGAGTGAKGLIIELQFGFAS